MLKPFGPYGVQKTSRAPRLLRTNACTSFNLKTTCRHETNYLISKRCGIFCNYWINLKVRSKLGESFVLLAVKQKIDSIRPNHIVGHRLIFMDIIITLIDIILLNKIVFRTVQDGNNKQRKFNKNIFRTMDYSYGRNGNNRDFARQL